MRLGILLLFFEVALLSTCLVPYTQAEIYVRMHEGGRKEFTNRPSGPGWIFYMSEDGIEPRIEFSSQGRDKSIDELVNEIAEKFNIDANLVKAVIMAESNCNPNAVSRKGAQGLMQLMPSTAGNLKVTQPFDPRENIIGGVKYIKGLLASYGDLKLALAAYNAGPGTVQKYAGIPPYRETIKYIDRVMDYYGKFAANPARRLGS